MSRTYDKSYAVRLITEDLNQEEFGEAIWELISIMTELQKQGRESGTVYSILRRDWNQVLDEYENRFGLEEFNKMWDGVQNRREGE